MTCRCVTLNIIYNHSISFTVIYVLVVHIVKCCLIYDDRDLNVREGLSFADE